MIRTSALILAAMLACASTARAERTSKGPLDGQSFVGEVGKMGARGDTPDELIFAKGQLRSTDCDQYGFGAAPYTVVTEGKRTLFRATTVSPDNGQIAWSGSIEGDMLEATFTWTNERRFWFDAEEKYWFKAKLKE